MPPSEKHLLSKRKSSKYVGAAEDARTAVQMGCLLDPLYEE